jgi:hypothetical protein
LWWEEADGILDCCFVLYLSYPCYQTRYYLLFSGSKPELAAAAAASPAIEKVILFFPCPLAIRNILKKVKIYD